jgi:hypothetical protein
MQTVTEHGHAKGRRWRRVLQPVNSTCPVCTRDFPIPAVITGQ